MVLLLFSLSLCLSLYLFLCPFFFISLFSWKFLFIFRTTTFLFCALAYDLITILFITLALVLAFLLTLNRCVINLLNEIVLWQLKVWKDYSRWIVLKKAFETSKHKRFSFSLMFKEATGMRAYHKVWIGSDHIGILMNTDYFPGCQLISVMRSEH